MDVDGKINGFSPVESVLVQLELLRQMWQNMLALHKNGGHPDKIFTFENMRMSDPNFAKIQEQLLKYKMVENKHGIMMFTGKVNVQDLQQIEDMQFQDMGLYITGVMAMQWQIPRSSIPYIVGSANTKDDTGGNSEKGYWRNIELAQYLIADTLNTQLFIPHFGVKIVFDNTFIMQDVQLQTARQLRLNNIKLENELLATHQKKLSYETMIRELGRSDIETEEGNVLEEGMNMQVQSTLDLQAAKGTSDTPEKQNVAKRKKTEQDNISKRTTTSSGVGKEISIKEWDSDAEKDLKELKEIEIKQSAEEIVDIQTFVKIYQQDQSYQSGMPPRLFMKQNRSFTSFKFKSSDFVYKSVIPTRDIEDLNVLLMNLGNNIYRL
jgi:hypothetical protein